MAGAAPAARPGSVPRRAIAFFLPAAVLATLCCGLVYGVAQQGLRMGTASSCSSRQRGS
jgi:hypothetical protein